MLGNIDRIKRVLLTPLGRTLSFVISVVLAGVLCSAFVAEITPNTNLDWASFYKKKSFWFIAALCIAYYAYAKYIYNVEKHRASLADDQYCFEYMRDACLPALAEKYADLIRLGKTSAELKELHADYESLFKGKRP